MAERFNRFYEEAFSDLDPWTMEGAPGVVVPAIGRRESAAPRPRADEVSVAQLLRGMREDIAVEFADQPEMAARALGCSSEEMLVASPGVIGEPIPLDRVRAGQGRTTEQEGDQQESGHGMARCSSAGSAET